MSALTLDHLVVAVRDLTVASASYERLLGRKPSWHGRHPTYGTANVLFRIVGGYLELLALDEAAADSPWAQALRQHLDSHGEGLYAVALGTDDIDASVEVARSRGLDVLDPAAGDGVDLESGAGRRWRNARIGPQSTRGVNTFFIQHDSPPDALPVAEPMANGASIVGFDHTVLFSSDMPATVALWRDAFGLDLRLSLDRPGGRQLNFFRLGDTILELAGEAAPEKPGQRDRLWGIAYRVDDLAATVHRLRDAGVVVSDPRQGNAPGSAVADLKPGFSHDVRTLFIEKEEANVPVTAAPASEGMAT